MSQDRRRNNLLLFIGHASKSIPFFTVEYLFRATNDYHFQKIIPVNVREGIIFLEMKEQGEDKFKELRQTLETRNTQTVKNGILLLAWLMNFNYHLIIMRLHRFYILEVIGDKKEVAISSLEQVNQIRQVFRLKTGDLIIIFDGSGFDYECRIEEFTKDSMSLAVVSKIKSRYIPIRDIYLCMAAVKKDTFEWIVEKATELGVTNIIPIIAERSEKKSLNMERLEKIAVEASEQSGRGNIPTIGEIVSLDEALVFLKKKENIELVAFHTESENNEILAKVGLAKISPIAVFIGPEGGWSPNEISVFHKNNVGIECLGQQILRSETAVVSALSLLVLGK
jgi:16S rRNA (uracil1498-N3)-methyltransferase